MHTTTKRRLGASAMALLLTAACSAGPENADSVDLEGGETAEQADATDATDDELDDGVRDEDAGDDAEVIDGDDTAASDGDVETSEGAGDAGASGSGHGLVDLTEAVPGTWPVGDAGTVTFSIVDGALVLDDVRAADGWAADIDTQDPDEIEVDFRRDNVEWEIEIELEQGGTMLEVEIDQDIEGADPGSYDLGDAGSFSFEVDGGQLVVTDLSVADGWTLVEREEEADEIEFELGNGPRQIDVEVELDDGVIEVEIDYEVTGPVSG
jgi:hypothetical protein